MRLSQIPDNVKRILLATCPEDVDGDELDALSPDELTFLEFYACPQGSALARLVLSCRAGVNLRAIDVAGNPWGDEEIEQDEPLPALTRDARIAGDAELVGCVGWTEAVARRSWDAGYSSRQELLRARYADVFERELHFGWKVPAFTTWAKGQTVPPPAERNV